MKRRSTSSPGFDHLMALSRGYTTSRVFLTAVELGLFSELSDGALSAREVASRIDADERVIGVLLEALTAMELLHKEGQCFRARDYVAELFQKERADNMAGIFLHAANLWENWSGLTETVRSGRPPDVKWTAKKSRDLGATMQRLARAKAGRLATVLDLKYAETMLDLGGGPGEYAIAFVRRYPNLKATVFDRDEWVLTLAEQEIKKQRLENRMNVKKGDILTDDFGSGYDMILLSSVICLFNPEAIITLVQKAKTALREGGSLVIVDVMTEASRIPPLASAIFAVTMLVATEQGRVYSSAQVESFLRDGGLDRIFRTDIDDIQVAIGFKPH